MSEIDTLVQIILGLPYFRPIFAVVGTTLAAVGVLLGCLRSWTKPRLLSAALTGFGVGLACAATLGRGPVFLGWHWGCHFRGDLSSTGPEAVLNAVLFMPMAFFGVLASRRLGTTVLLALAVSALIEEAQRVTALGVCQAADVLHNEAGALAAGVVAWLVLRVGAHLRNGDHSASARAPSAASAVVDDDQPLA